MNTVTLIGNLARDPDLNYTQSGAAKCTFTIAINRPKRNGEDQGADYIRIVTWGNRAEICERYLHKGLKVGVRGSIRTGSYTNQKGDKVYTTDVWAEDVEFLTPKSHQNNEDRDWHNETTRPAQEETFQVAFNDLPDTFSAADDDIPF